MEENRKYERYNKEIKIEYSFLNNNIISNTNGKVCNISLGGLYMVTKLLVDKNLPLDLQFSLVQNDELVVLKTTGTVLRSGTVVSENKIMNQYNYSLEDGDFFAVIKFSEPFLQLSFIIN